MTEQRKIITRLKKDEYISPESVENHRRAQEIRNTRRIAMNKQQLAAKIWESANKTCKVC